MFVIPLRSKSPTSDCGPATCIGRWNHNLNRGDRHVEEVIGSGPTASDALAAWEWPSSSTCKTTELAAFRFHHRVIASMPPRRINVGHAPEPQLVICSDADYEPVPRKPSTTGDRTLVLEQCITKTWKKPCGNSGHCDWHVVDAQTSHPKRCDWFVDNEAAAAAAIRFIQ